MGLFGLFGKKTGRAEAAPPEKEEEAFFLEDYAGMQAEVTDADGRLLFVAKLLGPEENHGDLHQLSEASISREMEEPLAVRLRGYSSRKSKAAYLTGTIFPAADDGIWRAENLALVKLENDRSFFRMDVSMDASLTPVSRIGAEEEPCRLLNISVGGVRIASASRHQNGDRLLLGVHLTPEKGPSTMLCQILRTAEREDGYEYGCRFIELSESDQDKIMQIIFNLQRKQSGRS